MSAYLYQESIQNWKDGQRKLIETIQTHHPNYKFNQNFTFEIETKAGNIDAYDWFRFQSFSLACIEEENIRLRVKAALAGAIRRGETVQDFYATLKSTFEDYKKVEIKALTLTYETQMSLAFGAAQQAKMIELQEDFPYWQYSAVMDSRTRPEHAKLHGKIFAATDHRYFPPIGFRCRCTIIPMTARQASRANPDDFIKPNETKEVGASEFIGNKQKRFASWLEDRYKKAEPMTKKLIDSALEKLNLENSQT